MTGLAAAALVLIEQRVDADRRKVGVRIRAHVTANSMGQQVAVSESLGDTDRMARRPPDEYQQRVIDDAVAEAAWIRWPLRKRLMWLALFAVITLMASAGVAVLLGTAEGAYVAAGVCESVAAACVLVGLALAAFAPEAWVRAIARSSTPRFEDLSSSRGFATPQSVPPHESDADAERRLARRIRELTESQKRLAGQLRHRDNGERNENTPEPDPPN